MEESIEKNEKGVSKFCDTLMNVTGALNGLQQPGDCAIVLCSDGTVVSSRQCGNYKAALEMVLCKMLHDDKFAELFVEASMLYSQQMGVKGTDQERE